jgi:hypothetical protein
MAVVVVSVPEEAENSGRECRVSESLDRPRQELDLVRRLGIIVPVRNRFSL